MSESESIKLPALRSQSRRDQNPTLAQLNSLQGIVGPMNTYLRETPNPTKRPFRRYHLATIFHLYVQSIDSHIIHLDRAETRRSIIWQNVSARRSCYQAAPDLGRDVIHEPSRDRHGAMKESSK